jgi:ankyrin repeat protein
MNGIGTYFAEWVLQRNNNNQTFLVAGYTPLHHCLTMYGTKTTMAMARVLLDRGADPNARTRFGNTPLCECVRHQKMDFIKLLLEYGVGPV